MRIFVGNIPVSASDGDLRQLFETYGQVHQARITTDRLTGRTRGFGFVDMPDVREAEAGGEGWAGGFIVALQSSGRFGAWTSFLAPQQTTSTPHHPLISALRWTRCFTRWASGLTRGTRRRCWRSGGCSPG